MNSENPDPNRTLGGDPGDAIHEVPHKYGEGPAQEVVKLPKTTPSKDASLILETRTRTGNVITHD